MTRVGYKFRWIDPSEPNAGCDAFPAVRGAHFRASSAYASDGAYTADGVHYKFERRTIAEIEECLEVIARILPGNDDEDAQAGKLPARDETGLPYLAVEALRTVFKASPRLSDRVSLSNGREVDGYHFIAAVCLAQCDRIAGAIVEGHAEHAAQLMWDVHIGVSLLDLPIHHAVSRAVVRRETSSPGGVGKNKENRQMKADALAHYRAHHAEYKSKADAAQAIAGKVVPVEFATVRRWLQGFDPTA